ncbi:ABC transporter ATP-binding protein [Capillimicrobium parvum]|uniref:Lipopolysaccharide export system ATP-binding protein LptB n=1 Tax=Capillimicrobium parvum TaxID=2884022 RepID=A0A9E6XYE3_9ACTN|nr:ABC transporter ATP-binding protein [Capillimicrobium parvum]UGS36535.1 Lipopolysaccharide export system ATP-binding protein LptB [Capillimicrobium parvum]
MSDEPGRSVFEARDVRVHYDGVRAVDGVDLTLRAGEIMGLIGPNGAGKSTLMGAISRFVPLTTGRIEVGGRDVSDWPPHRLVGLGVVRTFQDVVTFPTLTVFENVELGALGAGLSRSRARARARELLMGLDLHGVAGLPASALPHGDERRLGIARAVAAQPRFLLLDEPAAGLDDAESLELSATIVRIRDDSGCGVLLVEHDMRIIFGACESIHVLDFGKTLAAGPPEAVRADPRVMAAYLGQKGSEAAERHSHAERH